VGDVGKSSRYKALTLPRSLACAARAVMLDTLVLTTAISFGPMRSAGSADAASPSGQINAPSGQVSLGGWQLTLPVNSGGELSGKAAVVRPAGLSPPWLTREPDGGLRFWAPTGGATTPHSLHSRTELDFLTGFLAGEAGHSMTASVVVEQLPPVSQTVVIGQIHGYGPYSAAPFVLLELRGDALRVGVEDKPKMEGSTGPSDGEVTTVYPLLSNVALNREFTYTISAMRDSISITTEFRSAADPEGSPVSVSVPIPPDWMNHDVRFSAGDYEQDVASSSTTGGGTVIFYALDVTNSDSSSDVLPINTRGNIPQESAPQK
jgi:hypothetical protein